MDVLKTVIKPLKFAKRRLFISWLCCGYLKSIITKSYIFNSNHQLDVVSLTTDPENLFDEDTGIYVFGPYGTYDTNQPYFGANFWEDWEKPVHFA